MQHGRYLSGVDGLSGENETQPAYDVRFSDVHLRELEDEDDVFGSGIFDTYGSSATIHANMGVFADHPSLPGYIDREVQYEVNRNIADITAGADVVAVAGGGMTFMERNRFPVPFDRSGPTPCPPDLRPPPPTPVKQVFASLTRQMVPKDRGGGPKLLPPAVPERDMEPAPVEAGQLLRPAAPLEQTIPLGAYTVPSKLAWQPSVALPQRVGQRQIVHAAVVPSPVAQPFVPPELIQSHQLTPVGPRQIVTTASPSQVLAAWGTRALSQAPEEKKPIGWATYAFAGLLVGASAAMFFGATRGPKTRRR
jgi:hypothetical protein